MKTQSRNRTPLLNKINSAVTHITIFCMLCNRQELPFKQKELNIQAGGRFLRVGAINLERAQGENDG